MKKSYAQILFGLILALQILGFGRDGWADEGQFVTLPNGQQIYFEKYFKSEKYPTVILLNGLTYTTKAWSKMIAELNGEKLNVLVYDPRGMGKTLEQTGPAKEIIPLDTQVEDLDLIINEFEIQKPILVGLSYGGGLAIRYLALHPNTPSQIVLMAPFVKALKGQDQQIQQKIRWHRMMYPFDRKSDDELYDQYLKDIVFQTYPIYEPVVKEHPWRLEGVYQLVRGIRKFKASEQISKLPQHKIHLIVAEKDQYVPKEDHPEFWAALSDQQRLSHLLVKGSEHKIPEAKPVSASCWINEIAKENPLVLEDSKWIADENQTQIKGSKGTISCKSMLNGSGIKENGDQKPPAENNPNEVSPWKEESFEGSVVWTLQPEVINQATIILHGCAQTSTDLKNNAALEKTSFNHQTLMVLPSVPHGGVIMGCWDYYGPNHSNQEEPHAFLIRLAEQIKINHPEVKKINIAGISSGGTEVLLLGCLRPDLFNNLGVVVAPILGSDSGDLRSPIGTSTEVSALCSQLAKASLGQAGKPETYLKSQKIFLVSSPQDNIVNPEHSQIEFQSWQERLGATEVTKVALANLGGAQTGDLFIAKSPNAKSNQIAFAMVQGMGHNYPTGPEGKDGRFVKKNSLDFTNEFLKFSNSNTYP